MNAIMKFKVISKLHSDVASPLDKLLKFSEAQKFVERAAAAALG